MWTIIGVVVAALAIVVAVIIAVLQNERGSVKIDGDENQVFGDNAVVTNNYAAEVREFEGALPPNPGESQIRDAAEQYLSVNPEGHGPWPFVVIADQNLGLKVRTSGMADGQQVGSAPFNSIVWAECRMDTEFNPQPGDPSGSRWYRVRWPNAAPTSEFFTSSPSDQFDQWVYGGLVVPVGHNGEVPLCA